MSDTINVDTDIFNIRDLILTFNPTVFYTTMAVFGVVILTVLLLHGLLLVPQYCLKGYDFGTQSKREFGNILRFLYILIYCFNANEGLSYLRSLIFWCGWCCPLIILFECTWEIRP